MPRLIAEGVAQLRLAFTMQEHWEMVNKEVTSLQRAHNMRF